MRGPGSDRPAGARPPLHPPLGGEAGVQLVELAILLPLLMVLVVGVFDFGAAFNLKQQLTNAARSAAGFASIQPTNDLANGGVPDSVLSIRNLVDDRLVAAGINDCDLLRTGGGPSGALVWTFSAGGNVRTRERGADKGRRRPAERQIERTDFDMGERGEPCHRWPGPGWRAPDFLSQASAGDDGKRNPIERQLSFCECGCDRETPRLATA